MRRNTNLFITLLSVYLITNLKIKTGSEKIKKSKRTTWGKYTATGTALMKILMKYPITRKRLQLYLRRWMNNLTVNLTSQKHKKNCLFIDRWPHYYKYLLMKFCNNMIIKSFYNSVPTVVYCCKLVRYIVNPKYLPRIFS